jgi:hypothetical protein
MKLHVIYDQGACGCATPGSREPRRQASRPSGFDPSRKDFMSPSPGAVGPGSRRRRRRYADPPAAAPFNRSRCCTRPACRLRRLYALVAFDFPATQDCPAEIGWELFGEPNFVTRLATVRRGQDSGRGGAREVPECFAGRERVMSRRLMGRVKPDTVHCRSSRLGPQRSPMTTPKPM